MNEQNTRPSAKLKRIVVIGLDGSTFDIILPLVRQGHLPNIARLLQHGSHGDLISTIPPVTGSAWPSFMTGKNPGKHGLYGLMKLAPDSYEVLPVSSADRKARDLWEIISDHGKKVIILNVPITYPVRRVNGILISGFLTPPKAKDITYPPSILQEIEGKLGEYTISFEDERAKMERSVITDGTYEDAFVKDTIKTTAYHAKTLNYLMENKEWDFLMIEFQGTDGLQHIFWRDMDPTHPKHDPKRVEKYGNVIRDFYKQIDELVGELMRKLDDETAIFLVSDHGHTGFSKFISLNVFLMKQGYLKMRRSPRILVKRFMFHSGITPLNLFRLMNLLHLGRFRQSLRKEHVRRKIRGAFISLRDVDWRRTVAYSMGGWGQIYINLRGREPQGKIGEQEAKELTEKIIEQLNELKDPDSGTPIFGSRRIWRKEDIYFGPQTPLAPEIVAIPDPPYKTFPDYEFGLNKLVIEAYGWSGTHAINGIFLGAGPGVKEGFKLNNPRIIDVAPTILYLLGLPIPEDMDGKVLTEMIEDDILNKKPITVQAISTETIQQDYELTETDEEDLKKTLKGLGYL